MIPEKYRRLTFSFFMALFMTFLMSAIITFTNLGFVDNFVYKWVEAFYKAFLFAFPIVFFVAPTVQKLTNKLIKQKG